jgi:integrase
LPRIGASPRYLFTTNGTTPFSGVSKAMGRLTALAHKHTSGDGEHAPWRLHDLRRTFATGCARLGVALHVVEKSLNHTSGTFGGIVAVYQRHDFLPERTQAMEVWSQHITTLVDC